MNTSKISKTLLFALTATLLHMANASLVMADPTPTPTPSGAAIQFRIKPEVLEKIKSFIGRRAWLHEALVTKIEGTTITVTKDNITYMVLTDGSTIFRRKFGGKSSLAEVSVNDRLNILGKWNNEGKTEIKATRIRNLSVQKRFAVFFGEVKTINGATIVISTAKKGDQTIVTDDTTKLVNRKMEPITISDIQVGHRIRIKGTWDIVNKTVTEVKQIKDFTIPIVKPSLSPNPTPTATAE